MNAQNIRNEYYYLSSLFWGSSAGECKPDIKNRVFPGALGLYDNNSNLSI